jgi:predicted lipoprotein with Yx(FWY)xxD motif
VNVTHQRNVASVGVVAVIAIAAAAVASSHSTSHAASTTTRAVAIRTETATVNGKPKTILANGHGLPLYYYSGDTATKSFVTGTLARLWPPLTSRTVPAHRGLKGRVTLVRDIHGKQVAYNGHLLYTFVSDSRGVVTGKGVEGFFVARPGLHSIASSSPTSTPPTYPVGNGY